MKRMDTIRMDTKEINANKINAKEINTKETDTLRKNEVLNIIARKYLKSVYQPIVSLKDGSVLGYEALSRITDKEIKFSIADFFKYASELDCLWEVEKICRTNALNGAGNKPKHTKLFLNVDGNVLQDKQFQTGFTREKLDKYSLSVNDIVFEITERSDFEDSVRMLELMNHYRQQGYQVAIDDLGSGYSGLNRLQMIKPCYIKVDYELIHEIQKDKSKQSLVRMLTRYCNDMNYKLIAEGIETEEELKCLIGLGVEYGQGFLLGKPKEDFEKIKSSVVQMIADFQKKKPGAKKRIGNLGKMGSMLYPTCSIEYAQNLFRRNEALSYVAIVDTKCRFHGLLFRSQVEDIADSENMKKEAVSEIMETDVIQIDADISIKNTIGKLMYREENRFYEPFVLLKKDRYYGIATLRDVVIAIGKDL